MELSAIIPTRDRKAVLGETFARLEPQAAEVGFEVIVVDDGSIGARLARLASRDAQMPRAPAATDTTG